MLWCGVVSFRQHFCGVVSYRYHTTLLECLAASPKITDSYLKMTKSTPPNEIIYINDHPEVWTYNFWSRCPPTSDSGTKNMTVKLRFWVTNRFSLSIHYAKNLVYFMLQYNAVIVLFSRISLFFM